MVPPTPFSHHHHQQQQQPINYSSYSYLIRLAPLFLSISRCNHAATELLLTYDACPNIQDELGNTPLHLAVAKRQPCKQCVELLLKYHATSLVFNNRLQSPMTIINMVTSTAADYASSPQHNLNHLAQTPPTKTTTNIITATSITNSNSPTPASLSNPNDTNCGGDVGVNEESSLTKEKWDYSISSIYCTLIKDLFKKLDLIEVAIAAAAAAAAAQSDSTKKELQRVPTILQKHQLNPKSAYQLNNNATHASNNTPSKLSQKSVKSSTSNFKKSHTLAQNSASTVSHRPKRLPVSNSLKNLAKIKAYSSSNSLSTLVVAAAPSSGGGDGLNASSGSGKLLVQVGAGSCSSKQEFFKRMFRNHSSSVETPTGGGAEGATPTTTMTTNMSSVRPLSPPTLPQQASTMLASTQQTSPPNPSHPPTFTSWTKSPKIMVKQQTKVNLYIHSHSLLYY
jgi:hypothetical protein